MQITKAKAVIYSIRQRYRVTTSMPTVIAAIARTAMTTGVTYSFKTNYDYYYNSQAFATKCG
jgi:hypothetical protein